MAGAVDRINRGLHPRLLIRYSNNIRSARHLRTFRTAADREAGLLHQLLAPALRSRNPERREGGIQQLETLAELAQELSQLLFWRDLRQLASG